MANELQRKLGLWSAISIVVGSVIGSSIFMKPALMASQVHSPILLILVWLIAGCISLIGASINAEIGTLMPVTGGQYVYFDKMYGNRFAFIYGWACLTVINTAAIAAIAYVFATYLTYFIDLPRFSVEVEKSVYLKLPFIGTFYIFENIGVKCVAVTSIIGLTLANQISVIMGGLVQRIFAFAKIASLILLVVIVFGFGHGDVHNLVHNDATFEMSNWQVLMGVIAALSGAFAAFDGWNNLGFVAGEIDEPSKNIPRALIFGLLICLALYLLTNLAYFYMMPIEVVAKSSLLATDAVQPILGAMGAGFIAFLVMTSTFGATNGNILACARVTFTMGTDHKLFAWAGKVDARNATPTNALWLQCIICCVYVFTGTFDMLTDLFVFVTWLFYGFAAFGIFILRKKMKDDHRPFKAWAYPYLPALFVCFAFFYCVLTVVNDITNFVEGKAEVVNAGLGLVIVFSGLLVYRWKK